MRAFLALGSNLGDRLWNIKEALRLLSVRSALIRVSSVYETPAMYYTRQGDFYNAAAEIETGMTPLELLEETQAVERKLKRRRRFKNGPRTIDIDIILYGSQKIRAPGLRIPHPKLPERPFVLAPLREIAPGLRHPVSGLSARRMLELCPGAGSARRLPSDFAEAEAYLNRLPPSRSFSAVPERRALEALGRPQDSFFALHVAGTNGKGSVCAMLAAALSRCGHRTGLYLSPHITGPRERISADGRNIPEADLFRLFRRVASFGFGLSYFEYMTAIAMLWFRERGVRFAVVETGLGGRLDATNVFDRSLAVITNVSLEHAAALGGSVESIAAHKAGIIKKGCDVVTAASGKALSVIARRAAAAGGELFTAGPDGRFHNRGADVLLRTGARTLGLSLKGSYQLENAALAMKVLEVMRKRGRRLPPGRAEAGLAAARLQGRFETAGYAGVKLIFDCAHNPAAMSALFGSLRAAGFPKPVALAAMMKDKDAERMLGELCGGSRAAVLCGAGTPRAFRSGELAGIARAAGYPVLERKDAAGALRLALGMARKEGAPLLITGSFYLAAEIKALIKGTGRPVFPGELPPEITPRRNRPRKCRSPRNARTTRAYRAY